MMNRRKAMAAVAGGLVAGPKVARAALNPSNMPPAYPSVPAYGYGGAEGKLASDQAYTMESLAKLRRMAAGDFRDEDMGHATSGPPDTYAPMRSVSDSARQFLRNRYYERQWKERTIKAALDALDDYDKTGILRTFF